jgi:hypothetical protein
VAHYGTEYYTWKVRIETESNPVTGSLEPNSNLTTYVVSATAAGVVAEALAKFNAKTLRDKLLNHKITVEWPKLTEVKIDKSLSTTEPF